MAGKTDSQAQQHADTTRKIADEQVARMNALIEESKQFEERWVQQATHALDEMNRLSKSAIDYGVQLSTEWRKLTAEALQRSTELFIPRS